MSINGGFAGEGSDRGMESRDLVNNVSVLRNFAGENSTITRNFWTTTDGISVFEDNLEITDFTFDGTGTAIDIKGEIRATIKNIICNNLSLFSAVSISGEAKVDIEGSKFFQNTTNRGVIAVEGGNVRIRNTSIRLNHILGNGSGIGLTSSSSYVCAGSGSRLEGNIGSGGYTTSEVAIGRGTFSRETSVIIGPGNISDGSNTIVTSCPAPF
jgi:hypothetical protein